MTLKTYSMALCLHVDVRSTYSMLKITVNLGRRRTRHMALSNTNKL